MLVLGLGIRLWLLVGWLKIRRCWLWGRVIGSRRILWTSLSRSAGTHVLENEQRQVVPESCRSIHSADCNSVAEDSRGHGLEVV